VDSRSIGPLAEENANAGRLQKLAALRLCADPKSSALRNAFAFYSLLARSDSGDPHREAVGPDGVLDLGNQFEVRDGSPRGRCRGRRDELDFVALHGPTAAVQQQARPSPVSPRVRAAH